MPFSTSSSDPAVAGTTGLPSSRAARLWLAAFAACFTIVCGLLLVTLFTPAPYGDLTRVGALSEHAFGWTAPQPGWPDTPLTSSALNEADVLVVGDSFSIEPGRHPHAGLVWQSALVQAGHRVATLHWDIAHPLCADFNGWLQAQGFKGRWVLLQSAERMIDGRVDLTARPSRCTRNGPVDTRLSVPAPSPHPPPERLNTGEQLLTGVLTWRHTRLALRAPDGEVFQDPMAGEAARVHLVPGGCRLFSHRACERALFLAEDETKPRPTLEHVQAMRRVAQAPAPWRTAWVVMPNKTSVYLDPQPTARITAAIAHNQLGPDLMAVLAPHGPAGGASPAPKDLYFPNDTHLSPRGALIAGQAVAAWLEQASAADRAGGP